MTEEFPPVVHALLKVIDALAKENTQLGMEVDTLRYNKRYTNTKFVKKEVATLPEYRGVYIHTEPETRKTFKEAKKK